jgi:glycerophosphoryl diester phosphodiesterase
MRVLLSLNHTEILKLANEIYKKHNEDGANSPLNALKDHNWEEEGDKINPCMSKHLEAEDYRRKMEEAYKERDLLLNPLTEIVKESRDKLVDLYRNDLKQLEKWGFTIEDNPKSK